MTIQTLATSTAHFIYQWDDTVNGSMQRAIALQATCENDLTRLEDLFDEYNGFDNGNRVTVLVGDPGGGLASNRGYHDDGTTMITTVAWSAVNPASTADIGVRLEFVAEMSEVMMSLRNARKGDSWDPGGSNGEGLSQYLAEMFYRSGYYDNQLRHGPERMIPWLNDAARPPWVTNTEPSDTNTTSYGCALLFLHFLHTQKGYSVKNIITHGGKTLEDTCHNLTGNGGGWNEFSALLAKFYPSKDSSNNQIKYAPKQCNLFPLYDAGQRHIDVQVDVVRVFGGALITPGGSPVDISPGVLCPKDTYSWEWVNPNAYLRCTARPKGMGNPVVSWTVDSVAVPASGGSITVTGDVDLDRADHPESPARSIQTFRLWTSVRDVSTLDGPASQLTIHPMDFPGTERLTLGVQASEMYAAGITPYAVTTWTTLETHSVRYEPRYYADRERCREKWEEFILTHVRVKIINILLTLPDPGPGELQRPARMFEEIIQELARLSEVDAEMTTRLGGELARVLQISAATLGVRELAPDNFGAISP